MSSLRGDTASPAFNFNTGQPIPRASFEHKFGKTNNVTTVFRPVWSPGGSYPWPRAAEPIRIKAGGDADDTSDGRGARKVVAVGLDVNLDVVSAELITAGASASAATAQEFFRVYRVFVSEVGVYNGFNAGTIQIENTESADIIGHIDITESQSEQCIYTVPVKHMGYITRLSATFEESKLLSLRLCTRGDAGNTVNMLRPWRVRFQADARIGDGLQEIFNSPIVVDQETDIVVEAKVDTGTAACSAKFDIFMIEIR